MYTLCNNENCSMNRVDRRLSHLSYVISNIYVTKNGNGTRYNVYNWIMAEIDGSLLAKKKK